MPPVSMLTRRTASMRSRRPATTPAMTSEWPLSHFVADSTTRSAPSASGWQRYGEAKVLSTATTAPCAWPSSASRARSATTMVGLEMVSA